MSGSASNGDAQGEWVLRLVVAMFVVQLKHQAVIMTLKAYDLGKTLREHIEEMTGQEEQNMCEGWKEFDITKFMPGLRFHWLL
jgi:hypothetical protein